MLRANPQSDETEAIARDFPAHLQVNENGTWSRRWVGHPDPDIDVAVGRINFNALADQGMRAEFFASDAGTHSGKRSLRKKKLPRATSCTCSVFRWAEQVRQKRSHS